MEEDLVLVIDLDGTLIPEEISQRVYKEAYIETLERMKERGIEVPLEFYHHAFEKYCELSEKYELFNELYERVYPEVLEKYFNDIRKQRERAKRIFEYLVNLYRPKDIFILTANPKGADIIKEIFARDTQGKSFGCECIKICRRKGKKD